MHQIVWIKERLNTKTSTKKYAKLCNSERVSSKKYVKLYSKRTEVFSSTVSNYSFQYM